MMRHAQGRGGTGSRGIGSRTVLLVLVTIGTAGGLSAQSPDGRITGLVRDEDGDPIPLAQVFVPAAGRGTLTDSRGRFTLTSLREGEHVVHVTRIGYAPVRRAVRLILPSLREDVAITLESTPLTLPGVQVTGSIGSRDPLAVVQATTQLAGGDLQRELSGTLARTLELQPGISVRSMGPAASMPVMRGLTGDRILVLQDGRRTADLAGSADDHGVTIDPLLIERVEVIRGPATLLYGNNALGGVVNVISGEIPGRVPERAEWALSAQSESAHPGASVGLKGTLPLGGAWVAGFRGGGRAAGDVRIPDDPVLGGRLDNTAARSWTAGAGVGYVSGGTAAGASARAYDFAYGLPVPPGTDPVSLRGRRYELSGRVELTLASPLFPSLEVDGTAQDYAHDEIDDLADAVLQTFVLGTRTLNVLVRQGRVGPIAEGAWGLSGLVKDYAAAGPAALTPPARSRGIGFFAFQSVQLGGPALELGARFDDYRIRAREHEKFGPSRERAFPALSGSAGLRVPLGAAASASVSMARSFRAPTVEELFSGAAHAGTGAMELGNPDLEAERGTSLEGVVRVRSSRWNGQLAAYRSEIRNYVHLAARGDTVVSGLRLPVLVYRQEAAVLRGVEGSIEWAASRALVLGAMGDYVHAGHEDGTPLSFMPPPRLGLSARWDDGTYLLGGDAHHELRQDRVGAADEAPTPAHTIARLHAGVRFRLGGGLHSFTVRAENLTNALHREATSRIKDFAPGPGRSFAFVYRAIF